MKTTSLFLIFCLINYSLTQATQITVDQCAADFEEIIQTKCQGLGSCSFNPDDDSCIPISSCSGGETTCVNNIPSNYHKKKCEYQNSNCQEVDKVCTDYNKAINGIAIRGDTCSSLAKVPNKGDRCYFSFPNNDQVNQRHCITHYNICSSITPLLVGLSSTDQRNLCEENIPSDTKDKCQISGSDCSQVRRSCSEYIYLYQWADKTNCKTLVASTGATCIFDNDRCSEAYPCSYWDSDPSNCDDKTPLNDAGDGLDYLYKCKYDANEASIHKCKKIRKTCDDYNNNNLNIGDTICEQFIAKDSEKKQCFYDSGSCQEQYKTCQLYEDNEVDKSRASCEKINLSDTNKKCVYIKEEHKCEEGNVYNNCNDYKGTDKKICENILSPKRNSYCVLDKDSICKEREFHCEEAYDRYDCLIYAKPTDGNKKCVWNGIGCSEQIKGCEDYIYKNSNSENTCNALEVYNGKKCYYDFEQCKSKDKKCNEAKSKEECELIEKIGVSDPDRKICEWIGSIYVTGNYCQENYKYCSDYRPTDHSTNQANLPNYKTICNQIKPYNEKTNTLDVAFTCDIKDPKVGCEKVPKQCSAGNGNKILCELISPVIKDNRIKYCAFINNQCEEHYKTCELVDENYLSSKCSGNIPQNYLTKEICEIKYDTNGNPLRCGIKEEKCTSFKKDYYEDLCLAIHHNCSYSSNSGCYNQTTKTCSSIKFYTASDDNKEICNELSRDDYICTLKEDKSGCEEVLRESIPFHYAINANNNSWKLNGQRIYIILAFLSLLF